MDIERKFTIARVIFYLCLVLMLWSVLGWLAALDARKRCQANGYDNGYATLTFQQVCVNYHLNKPDEKVYLK